MLAAYPVVAWFENSVVMLTIPRDLLEAAKFDGAGELKASRFVVLPLCQPLVAVRFFMDPRKDNQLFTLAIGLPYLQRQFGSDYGGTMASADQSVRLRM